MSDISAPVLRIVDNDFQVGALLVLIALAWIGVMWYVARLFKPRGRD